MFVLSFKTSNDDPTRTRNLFDRYYMPLVEIKGFSALTYNKPFWGQPVNQLKTNKNHLKNLLKRQEMMTKQQEVY